MARLDSAFWLALLSIGVVTAACTSGGTVRPSGSDSPVPVASTQALVSPTSTAGPTVSSTPIPIATSFATYGVAFCSAFNALFVAVGNPDTGSGSVLSKALDSAVAAGDGASADQLSAKITTELESGRHAGAAAGGWPPAAPMIAQLDRVFVAFEAMVAAKDATAKRTPGAVDPQAAFEQAGGAEAWTAMFDAYRAIGSERPAGAQACANLPISP